MLAGYAQAVITPALNQLVYLAGFGQNRVAQSIHDDLYVRALALGQDDTRLTLVALDLIGLPRHHCLDIAQHVNEHVPGARVLVACTHTHHGPDTIGLWGPDIDTSGVNDDYMARLKGCIVQTIVQALNRLEPAYLRCASTTVTGLAKNVRDPLVKDEELSCVQFCSPEDTRVVATWLIYPCHPEVLWEYNPIITSDYPSTLRECVEAATYAPSMFMVGALGGMMTPDVQEHSFAEAAAMGEALARAALDALGKMPVALVKSLTLEQQEYSVPLRSVLLEQALESELLLDRRNSRGEIVTEANLIQLGDVWVATVPGELLPKLGLLVKEKLRRVGAEFAIVIGLVNDEIGYILPDDEYVYPDNPIEPGAHYEETMSIAPDAGSRLLAALDTLITH
jgi:hypothetical protein